MENVTENSKIITFEKDTPEEGDTTASQTDVTDAYESALANWHGGYDGQGDYTGEASMTPMATMWDHSLQRKVLRRWATGTAVIWRMEALPAMDSWMKTEIM